VESEGGENTPGEWGSQLEGRDVTCVETFSNAGGKTEVARGGGLTRNDLAAHKESQRGGIVFFIVRGLCPSKGNEEKGIRFKPKKGWTVNIELWGGTIMGGK